MESDRFGNRRRSSGLTFVPLPSRGCGPALKWSRPAAMIASSPEDVLLEGRSSVVDASVGLRLAPPNCSERCALRSCSRPHGWRVGTAARCGLWSTSWASSTPRLPPWRQSLPRLLKITRTPRSCAVCPDWVLGARVLAEFGDDRTRYQDARWRRCYAGSAPITRTSGTRLVGPDPGRAQPPSRRCAVPVGLLHADAIAWCAFLLHGPSRPRPHASSGASCPC